MRGTRTEQKKSKVSAAAKTILFLAIFIINLATALSLPISLSDQGEEVKYNGQTIPQGNLTVQIWSMASGGTLLYEENFTNRIINGSWAVMLGDSGNLELNYSVKYYKDYKVNGNDLNFTNNTGGITNRIAFYSPLGAVNASLIAGTIPGDGTGGWTNNSENTTTTSNVGIGTASPDGLLHAYSNTQGLARIHGKFENINESGRAQLIVTSGAYPANFFALMTHGRGVTDNYYPTALGATNDSGKGILLGQGVQMTEFIIGTYNEKPLSLFTNNTNRLVILSKGDIGIATMSPTEKLDVNGSIIAEINVSADNFYGNINASYVQNAPWISGSQLQAVNATAIDGNNTAYSSQIRISTINDTQSADNITVTAAIAAKLSTTDQRYNETVLIAGKLDETDQRFNESARLQFVNDTQSADNTTLTAAIAAKLSMTDQRYNETALSLSANSTANEANQTASSFGSRLQSINDTQSADNTTLTAVIAAKMAMTDQRYNESGELESINTTANMRDLGFNTTSELDNRYLQTTPYQNSAAGWTNNSENTTTTLNVGIGTTGPVVPLQIAHDYGVGDGEHALLHLTRIYGGAGGITAGYLANGTAVTGSYIRQGALSGTFSLGTVDAPQALHMTSTGNIGVNTTDPSFGGVVASKLSIAQTDSTSGLVIGNATTPRFALNGLENGSWVMYDYYGDVWNKGISQRGGNAGMGTFLPSEKLHVNGSLRVDNSTGDAVFYVNQSSGITSIGALPANNNADLFVKGYVQTNGWGAYRFGDQGSAGIQGQGYGVGSDSLELFTEWTPRLSIEDNGYVGIGTTDPSDTLNVNGSLRVDDSSGPMFQVNTSDKYTKVTGNFSVSDGAGQTPFSVDYLEGNVGVNTDAPQATLHVRYSPIVMDSFLAVMSDIDSTSGVYLSETTTFDNTGFGMIYEGSNNLFTIKSGSSAIDNTRLAIERDTGRVGIGTRSPSEKLQVNGSLRVDNSTGSAVLFVNSTSGNIGIGTSSPNSRLHINGSGGTGGLRITLTDSDAGGVQWALVDGGSSIGGAGLFHIRDGTAGANRLTIQNVTGFVGINTTSPNAKLQVAGNISLGDSTPVQSGKALCWTATGTIGYCSDQPDGTGSCTCNQIS